MMCPCGKEFETIRERLNHIVLDRCEPARKELEARNIVMATVTLASQGHQAVEDGKREREFAADH